MGRRRRSGPTFASVHPRCSPRDSGLKILFYARCAHFYLPIYLQRVCETTGASFGPCAGGSFDEAPPALREGVEGVKCQSAVDRAVEMSIIVHD